MNSTKAPAPPPALDLVACPRCRGTGGNEWPDGMTGHGCGPEFEECDACHGRKWIDASQAAAIEHQDAAQVIWATVRICLGFGIVISGIASGMYIAGRFYNLIDDTGHLSGWAALGGLLGLAFGCVVLVILFRFVPPLRRPRFIRHGNTVSQVLFR